MSARSPMLRALLAAHDELPEELARFDELARAGAAAPSFEEYSARLGQGVSPWRETCYFDVASDPGLVAVANERFEVLAAELGFAIPAAFFQILRAGGVAGPEVLQIVLGIDAGSACAAGAAAARVRLKYYLIFRDRSGATVERLRAGLELPELPASLEPDSVYILGVDFERGGLSDFKLYVRLDSRRVPAVIRNLGRFEALWRGSRYLVFQRCLLGGGRQVYFHLSSARVLEAWLRDWAARDQPIAGFARRLAAMNEQLRGAGQATLRPWIASFPYRGGGIAAAPSNVYFHFSESG